MTKRRAEKAAICRIFEDADPEGLSMVRPHTDLGSGEKMYGARIGVAPNGGYQVSPTNNHPSAIAFPVAAFSTKPELLAWLDRNLR